MPEFERTDASICQECGCDTRIIRSEKTAGRIIRRRRECRDPTCRARQTTWEISKQDKEVFESAIKAIRGFQNILNQFYG